MQLAGPRPAERPDKRLRRRFRDRGLPAATITALIRQDVESPERLLFMSDGELASLSGIGDRRFREIQNYRANVGQQVPAESY
jgi:hypothetical protein